MTILLITQILQNENRDLLPAKHQFKKGETYDIDKGRTDLLEAQSKKIRDLIQRLSKLTKRSQIIKSSHPNHFIDETQLKRF